MKTLHAYALSAALKTEAQEVQREDRAELMNQAAAEIESLISENRRLHDALERLMPIASALVCNPASSQAERQCHASEHAIAQSQARKALGLPTKANAVEVVLDVCQECGANAVNPNTDHCMKCGRPQLIG